MQGSFSKRGCKCEEDTKCKCGAKWNFVLDIGRDPITNKRRQKSKGGFSTKKEAEAACAKLINQVESEQYTEQSKMPFSEFLKQYLKTKETLIKKNTLANYKRHIESNINPYLGKLQLAKITPNDITGLYSLLLSEREGKKGLAATSIGDVHKVIYNALDQALRYEYIIRNPAALVKRPRAVKSEIQVWDLKQATQFLKVAEADRTYIAFLLALTTGMRQGEILGLRWKDINMKEGTLRIVQTLSHDGKELTAGAKTDAGNRVISIDPKTVAELKKYKKKLIAEQVEAIEYNTKLDLVMPTSVGSILIPRNLMRSYYRLIDDAKVPKIKFHDLRHTHATLLLKQGAHPKIVSERLGHAGVRTTLDIYSHVLPDMQKDAATTFGKMFYK